MNSDSSINKGWLDPRSYVPLYMQLYAMLSRAVEEGHYKAGEQLPSERELSESFSVSRITSGSAIQELVRAGLAYRVQGKGTFVARPKIRGLSSFDSFSSDICQRGMVPSSRLISCEKLIPDEEVQERLSLPPEECCFELVRVRLADNEPVAIETTYIPEKLCPGLENEDLERGSLFETFRRRYGLFPTWSEGIFEAAPANEQQAELLELNLGDPVLLIHRVTFDENYVPLEWVHSVYRADRFSFSTGRQPVG